MLSHKLLMVVVVGGVVVVVGGGVVVVVGGGVVVVVQIGGPVKHPTQVLSTSSQVLKRKHVP